MLVPTSWCLISNYISNIDEHNGRIYVHVPSIDKQVKPQVRTMMTRRPEKDPTFFLNCSVK